MLNQISCCRSCHLFNRYLSGPFCGLGLVLTVLPSQAYHGEDLKLKPIGSLGKAVLQERLLRAQTVTSIKDVRVEEIMAHLPYHYPPRSCSSASGGMSEGYSRSRGGEGAEQWGNEAEEEAVPGSGGLEKVCGRKAMRMEGRW